MITSWTRCWSPLRKSRIEVTTPLMIGLQVLEKTATRLRSAVLLGLRAGALAEQTGGQLLGPAGRSRSSCPVPPGPGRPLTAPRYDPRIRP